jgi:hypothetical protein
MKRSKITAFVILSLASVPALIMMVACTDLPAGVHKSTTASSSGSSGSMGGDGPGGSGGSGDAGGGSAGAGDAGGGGAGGAGGAVGQCGRTCTAAADCCPPGQPSCPGDRYPNNFTCEAGICKSPRCAVKEDCTAGGTLPNEDCVSIQGQMSCAHPCASDGDCSAGATCTGVDDSGNKLCKTTSPSFMCSDDAGCGGLGKCNAAGDGCYCSEPGDCTHAYFKDCVL